MQHAWERGRIHIEFWCESQKERVYWEDIDLGGRIILKMNFREIGWDDIDWTDVAQDRDQCRALVNTVMNVPVP
jgi:hypothetical protein